MYIDNVNTLDDAKECARDIIHSAWAHGFTEDLHLNAMDRLLDRLADVQAEPRKKGN